MKVEDLPLKLAVYSEVFCYYLWWCCLEVHTLNDCVTQQEELSIILRFAFSVSKADLMKKMETEAQNNNLSDELLDGGGAQDQELVGDAQTLKEPGKDYFLCSAHKLGKHSGMLEFKYC